MWYYIMIFAISILCLRIENKRYVKIICNIILLLMMYMTAFRADTIGIDTHNYKDIFESGYRLAAYIKEFLFSGLGLLIYNFNEDYRYFQVLMALITYLPWFYLLNKKTDNIAVALLLFVFSTNRYFFETFNMMRQAAATPYLLITWFLLYEKKYFYAVLAFIIAVGFHTSSLFYVPIVFIAWKWTFTQRSIKILILGTLVFAFLFANMSTITNLISMLTPIAFQELIGLDHYASYRQELARTTFGLLPMLLPNAYIAFFYYEKNKDNFLMRIFIYGAIFLNIISVYPMSYRISYGVIALEIFLFPLLLNYKSKYRNGLIFVILCIVLYSLFDFFTTCYMGAASLVPYKNFL